MTKVKSENIKKYRFSKQIVRLAKPRHTRLKYQKWCRKLAKKQHERKKRWIQSIPEANARLIELATPRHKRKKHRRQRTRRKYLLKQKYVAFKASPRLTDLSYCPVRRLVSAKFEYRFLQRSQQQKLNKHIQLSAASIYSKLAKREAPTSRKHREKWTDSDWEKHAPYIEHLAKTKKLYVETEKKWPSTPINMRLIKMLADPFPRNITNKYPWGDPSFSDPIDNVSPEAQKYCPSENIENLAKPKMPREKYNPTVSEEIDAGTLEFLEKCQLDIPEPARYMAHVKSKGLNELIKPKNTRSKYVKVDIVEGFAKMFPNALKYKATIRIKKLAEPREDQGESPRDNFTVSKSALKYKPSERITKLSKPRVS